MDAEDISPFFSRCRLKASRKALDEKNQRAGMARQAGSSYSAQCSPDSIARRDDSPDYPKGADSGRFDAQ